MTKATRPTNDPRALTSEDAAPDRRSDEPVLAVPQPLPMALARRSKQPSAAPSIICADIVLQGALESTGVIHLDGRLEGNVRSAVLVVGDKGAIQGEVTADDVTVRGSVRGNIRARKVLLGSGARVEGDILYESFAAESGAQFVGYCRHADDPLSQELPSVMTADADAPPAHEPEVPEDALEADMLSREARRSQSAA
jgi:cytoskeletal protein CcmA (bactofilin family)